MCKQKCYIQFEGLETLGTDKIRISCNDFCTQLKKLNSQYEEHKNDNDDFEIHKMELTFEQEGCFIYMTYFSICTSNIYLYKYVAKEGFYFKSNK